MAGCCQVRYFFVAILALWGLLIIDTEVLITICIHPVHLPSSLLDLCEGEEAKISLTEAGAAEAAGCVSGISGIVSIKNPSNQFPHGGGGRMR